MSQCFVSLAWASHSEHFTIKSSVWERVPFSVWSLVSVEVRPVSKNCSCSWSARAPDCPSLPVRSCLLADQYSPAHFCMGLGRQSATFHSILNSLYLTLPAHKTLTTQSVWMGEWVWTHQNLWHYGLLLHFLLAYISPSTPPWKSSWGFLLSTNIWLVH